jgi:hypothetical protein
MRSREALSDETLKVKGAVFSHRNRRHSNHCGQWECAVDVGESVVSAVEVLDSDLRPDSRRVDGEKQDIFAGPIDQTCDRLHLSGKGTVNESDFSLRLPQRRSSVGFPPFDRFSPFHLERKVIDQILRLIGIGVWCRPDTSTTLRSRPSSRSVRTHVPR